MRYFKRNPVILPSSGKIVDFEGNPESFFIANDDLTLGKYLGEKKLWRLDISVVEVMENYWTEVTEDKGEIFLQLL